LHKIRTLGGAYARCLRALCPLLRGLDRSSIVGSGAKDAKGDEQVTLMGTRHAGGLLAS
jgi:hypothetical protein